MGVTGFEPVTLRLSSACSNQLSYTPDAPRWRHGDSNPRPIACKATALPTELCPLRFGKFGVTLPVGLFVAKQKLNCALPFQIFKAWLAFTRPGFQRVTRSAE